MPTLGKWTTEGATQMREGTYLKELTRVAYVTGIAAESTFVAMLNDPSTSIPGMPNPWDTHPSNSDMRVVSYDVRPLSGQACTIVLRYVNTTITTIRGGTGLESIQTDMDKNGNPIIVEYTGDPTNNITVPKAEQKQSGVISVTDTQSSLIFTRIEAGTTYGGIDPGDISHQFTNKTNSVSWRGAAVGEWLCENITFDPDGMDGVAWLMTYEFQWKRYGWNPEVNYLDRNTGQPPPNIPRTGHPARQIVDWYEEIDFNTLNL